MENNVEDTNPKHVHFDILGRRWHRHVSGTIYCDGTLVAYVAGGQISVTASDSIMVRTASELLWAWDKI